jgi:uncharacterized protein YbgA (DUF1722 family)
MEYDTILGANNSETWTANVKYPNGTNYSETFTHAATIPASTRFVAAEAQVTSPYRIMSPTTMPYGKVKKEGVIKMTSYDRGLIVTTNNVIQIPRQSFCYIKRGAYTVTTDNKYFYQRVDHLFDRTADYWIQGDFNSLVTRFPTLPIHRIEDALNANSGILYDAVQSAEAQVISALNSSYDALTDFSEIRETLQLIKSLLDAVHHPLSSFRDLRNRILGKSGTFNKKSAKQAYKEVADAWMQYRYGIMPIVYSVGDLMKLLKKNKRLYNSEKAFRGIDLNEVNLDIPDHMCFYEQIAGTVTVKATGKQMGSVNALLRLIDGISVNPFKTAWELIPYSFVVDWFLNVGDYIDAHLGSLVSFSEGRTHCYAIKSNYTRSMYFRDVYDNRVNLHTGPWTVSQGVVFPRSDKSFGCLYDASYLLRAETFNTYERRVFTNQDVELKFDPFLNWKRFIDGFVLGLSNTRRALRLLK